MKKVLSIMMVVAMCMALAACGGSEQPAGSASPSPSEAASAQPGASTEPSASASTEPGASASAEPSASAGGESAGGGDLEAIKAAGKIVMVTSPDFAPYEFIDLNNNNAVVGMDISLGKYIAEELGVELEIKTMDFDATLAAVATGNCDFGISGYSPDAKRSETMDFSEIYYEGNQVVVIRKEDADKYKTAEDLKDQPVAAQNASEQQKIVEGQLEGAVLKLFTKVPEEVMALKSKQVEAVALEGPNAEQIVSSNDDLMVSEIKVEGETTGTAVGIPKGSDELVAEINRIIQKAKDENKFTEWLDEAVQIYQAIN